VTSGLKATLADALGIAVGDVVAFTGGGGKTSAILCLTEELRRSGVSVLATTTTLVGERFTSTLPTLTVDADHDGKDLLTKLESHLRREGATLLVRPVAKSKYSGPPVEFLREITSCAMADVTLIEADGARQRPLKAPADHEPVIPASGLDALGQSVSAPAVHRPELLLAISKESTVGPGVVADVLASPEGGMKGIPKGARVRPLLNKARSVDHADALATVDSLDAKLPACVDRIILAEILESVFTVFHRDRC
jgi:molybdenum cofactor cytidylyltransferase